MLRNGKVYISATSSANSDASYQYPGSQTLDSSPHRLGEEEQSESFVIDSEVERIYKVTDKTIPEAEEAQLPERSDAGEQTPMPTSQVDAVDVIPTMNVIAPDSREYGSELQINDTLENRATGRNSAIGDDNLKRPLPRTASTPEGYVYSFQTYGPKEFSDNSFAELLEHDAQPRNEEDFSDFDEYEYDEYEIGGMMLSPGTRRLINSIERLEDLDTKETKRVHLMSSRKHEDERRERDGDEEAGPSRNPHGIKGKGREPGNRTEQTKTMNVHKALAKVLEEERAKNATNEANEAKAKPKKKSNGKKSHLRLTQWIETPSPSPETRVPEASPVRALKQLPSGLDRKYWQEEKT
ncbi:hypothetical protein FRC00_002614 [Tulasnella sp. 408]|nr:hypothetical protein FRC00_002614 [Tulasnella sp. 408]